MVQVRLVPWPLRPPVPASCCAQTVQRVAVHARLGMKQLLFARRSRGPWRPAGARHGRAAPSPASVSLDPHAAASALMPAGRVRIACRRPLDLESRNEKIKALIAQMPLENEKVWRSAACASQRHACVSARCAVLSLPPRLF